MSRQHRRPKYEGDVRFVELATYTSPKIVEDPRKNFISYGEDNNYYQYLIDQFNGSPTNHACISAISSLILGRGLDATDSDKKPDQYAAMVSLFKEDVIQKIVYDFYLMGGAALQIIYSKDRSRVAQVEHMPVETLSAEKSNNKGAIPAYYYFHDWSEYKNSSKLTRIPSFGTSNESREILFIKPYKAGYYYYSPVAYQGGLQYAELESEISNFHMNNIKNGLSPSMIINFNNGVPNEEERSMIEQKVHQKFSGSSNAGRFILAFNDGTETQTTIEPIQLSDAHQQYQFLSTESQEKILVAHRVVSPMLLGVKNNTGLGNNADELEKASTLMDNMVIRPYQKLLIDCFNKILRFNNIALNLYFKTLQPLEFTDLENVVDAETREEETGQKLSLKKNKMQIHRVNEILTKDVAKQLIAFGEDEDLETWDIISEQEVDYENDDKLNEMLELASAKDIKSTKSKKSTDDKALFKVRYKYTGGVRKNTRDFCRTLFNARKIYRKEDIKSMTDKVVNPGFGEGGSDKYSIWLYKGGPNCYHKWTRVVYFRKRNTDGTFMPNKGLANDKIIPEAQARSQGFTPKNIGKAGIAPRDMEHQGYKTAKKNRK